MGTSRLGGVPTVLPPPDSLPPPGQLGLDLVGPDAVAAPVHREVLPDVVHVAGWLDLGRQRALADDFRRWAVPPAGLRHPRVPAGHLMTRAVGVPRLALAAVRLQPHGRRHRRRAGEAVARRRDRARPPGRRRHVRSANRGLRYEPDAAIVNLYAPGARLGLHQDGEEPSDAPVVTISLGDTCVFRLAGVDRRTSPFVDVELRSGDLLVFGGANRRIYHGVPKVLDGTGPQGLGLPPGRLSITVRETGL